MATTTASHLVCKVRLIMLQLKPYITKVPVSVADLGSSIDAASHVSLCGDASSHRRRIGGRMCTGHRWRSPLCTRRRMADSHPVDGQLNRPSAELANQAAAPVATQTAAIWAPVVGGASLATAAWRPSLVPAMAEVEGLSAAVLRGRAATHTPQSHQRHKALATRKPRLILRAPWAPTKLRPTSPPRAFLRSRPLTGTMAKKQQAHPQAGLPIRAVHRWH